MTTFQTFKDFLKPSVTNDLQEKCAPFIEQSKGRPLYRGYGGAISAVFSGAREIPIRKDRRPRDSTQYVHALLDAYFQQKFGVKVRSEGLFTTGDRSAAENYGHPYYVLPVGEFKYVWGTYKGAAVRDTLQWARKLENMMRVRHEHESAATTQAVMDEIDWHTDDLPRAIASGAEIAILADKVIIIPFNEKVPYSKIINGTA